MENNAGSKTKKNGKVNMSGWTIGGTTMLGIGVGLILLPISALLLVASIIIGIGTGLVMVPIMSIWSKLTKPNLDKDNIILGIRSHPSNSHPNEKLII